MQILKGSRKTAGRMASGADPGIDAICREAAITGGRPKERLSAVYGIPGEGRGHGTAASL